MVHFYSQDYQAVLDMPIKLFWTLCNNIQRIQARDDMRALSIATAASMAGGMGGATEGVQQLNDQLLAERGTVIKTKFDPIGQAQLDREGLELLRAASKKKTVSEQ